MVSSTNLRRKQIMFINILGLYAVVVTIILLTKENTKYMEKKAKEEKERHKQWLEYNRNR
jgi:hypothetical protein